MAKSLMSISNSNFLKLIYRSRFFIISAISITIWMYICLQLAENLIYSNGLILNNNQLLGGDFICFYSSGKLAKNDIENLYDFILQKQYRLNTFSFPIESIIGELPFIYPPFIASIFKILSDMEFKTAFLLFSTFALASSFTSVIMLSKFLKFSNKDIILLLVLILGYTPFTLNTLIGGQLSWLGIVIYSLSIIFIIRKKDFLSGLIFSISYYKPPIFFISLILLIAFRGKRFLYGFLTGACVLVTHAYFELGINGFKKYLTSLTKYTYGKELLPGITLPPSEGMGLYTLFYQLINNYSIAVLTYIICLTFLILVLIHLKPKNNENNDSYKFLWLATSIVASLSFSIQILKYDLAILCIAFILIFSCLNTIGAFHRFALLACMAMFYFEFNFRQIRVGGNIFNSSSFIFIFIDIILISALINNKINKDLNITL